MARYSGSSHLSIAISAVLLALLLCVKLCTGSRTTLTLKPENAGFIKTCCSTTTYPSLCYSSLSSYASEIQTSPMLLTCTSLSLALNATRSAYSAINTMSTRGGMSPRVAAAMRDCKETVGDSADQLKQSMSAMEHLRGKDLGFQLNSVQTWVSAAITNDYTCTDGFDDDRAMEGQVKAAVRRYVLHAEQLTSNALAFINRLATDHSH